MDAAGLELRNRGICTHGFDVGRDNEFVSAKRHLAAVDRIRELEDRIKAEIGILTTPTGLFGRDNATQRAVYERRVEDVANRLRAVLKAEQ